MPETQDADYLSIGEVLGSLLEEFPDVTISKIRFLESQGLISPERTPSGYRRFTDEDVELLRVILTEQKQNYLPLRVIKDRLETGEIDPTGEHLRPNGTRDGGPGPDAVGERSPEEGAPGAGSATSSDDGDDEPAEVPAASIASHPAARRQPERPGERQPDPAPAAPATRTPAQPRQAEPSRQPDQRGDDRVAETQLLPGVLLDRAELCSMVGMTDAELTQLESFGIVVADERAGQRLYGDDAVQIAKPACEFLRAGVDARHLRNYRTSAEREASLYEQLVAPRFRQRNPEARADALAQLRRLDALGGSLRAAMMRQALRRHFD